MCTVPANNVNNRFFLVLVSPSIRIKDIIAAMKSNKGLRLLESPFYVFQLIDTISLSPFSRNRHHIENDVLLKKNFTSD
jgi:hypothetical protein